MKIPWIIIPSIIGSTLVTFGVSFYANIFYLIGSSILCIHNYKQQDMQQAALFGIYVVLAIIGVFYNYKV